MSVETALYTLLSTHAGLSALVSNRIYPLVLPQSPTFPACGYRRVSSRIISKLSTDTNLIEGRFEVTGFSKSYDESVDVADQIRQALQRVKGTYSSVIIEDITIDGIDQDLEMDFEIFESTVDVTITYRT